MKIVILLLLSVNLFALSIQDTPNYKQSLSVYDDAEFFDYAENVNVDIMGYNCRYINRKETIKEAIRFANNTPKIQKELETIFNEDYYLHCKFLHLDAYNITVYNYLKGHSYSVLFIEGYED